MELSSSPTSTTITVVGDLDVAERDQFPQLLARTAGIRRQLLVVDMCRTTFLDSTGAAFLISLAEQTSRRGGVTLLRGVDERNHFVLEVCGALEMFRIDEEHVCEQGETASRWQVR